MTIVLDAPPVLQAGVSWQHQPAHVDKSGLFRLTNYYHRDNYRFDDFSLTILAVDNGDISCELIGYVDFEDAPRTPVTVSARFVRDEGVLRSFSL